MYLKDIESYYLLFLFLVYYLIFVIFFFNFVINFNLRLKNNFFDFMFI